MTNDNRTKQNKAINFNYLRNAFSVKSSSHHSKMCNKDCCNSSNLDQKKNSQKAEHSGAKIVKNFQFRNVNRNFKKMLILAFEAIM